MALEPKAQAILTRLLEAESPEVQARTWRVVSELDCEIAAEFFCIFVAMAQLTTLVESVPNEWRLLFRELNGGLQEWSQQNLQTLEGVTEQSRALTSFSELVTNLSSATHNLASTTADLSKASLSSTKQSETLQKTLSEYKPLLRDIASSRESYQNSINKVLSQLNKALNVKSVLNDRLVGTMVLAGSGLMIGLSLVMFWQVDTLNLRVARDDCGAGIIPKESRVCQRLCAREWIRPEHIVCQ